MNSKEVIEVLSNIRQTAPKTSIAPVYISEEERAAAVEILNTLAIKGCSIHEATAILDYCKYSLQFCPVISFE